MHRTLLVLAAAALVLTTACTSREPVPLTPPAEVRDAPVVRQPAEPLASAPPSTAAPSTPAPPLAGIVVPSDAIYVCVSERNGERAQTVIAFEPRVLGLCRRHPEMGPCQYERNVCRASGGRVFAANGQEITMATEAEYDRKVRRVTFRSN